MRFLLSAGYCLHLCLWLKNCTLFFYSEQHHNIRTAFEEGLSLFIPQLLVITPVINIHQEINICVYSDLC